MTRQINQRTSILLLIFIVLGITYPVIFSHLNSVDDVDMYNHLLNTDGLTLQHIFTSGGGQYFRPLLALTFLFDKKIWGLQESFMHLDNIIFHLVNVLLVFAIARIIWERFEGRESLAPLVAALLFAIHPINVEPVAWISGRTDLIAGMFIFLAFYIMLTAEGKRYSAGYSLVSAGFVLIACLAKETAVFFLPALLIIPFFHLKKSETNFFPKFLFNFSIHFLTISSSALIYLLVRTDGLKRSDKGISTVISHVVSGQQLDLLQTVKIIAKASGFYLKKLFIPFPLNFAIIHVSDFYIVLGVLLFPLVIWWLYRRDLTSYLFICTFSLSVSALIIPFLHVTWTPLAERYMYLPSAFFILGITLVLDRYFALTTHKRFTLVLVCSIFTIAAYGTASRILVWQDNFRLYQDTLKKSPGFVPAQNEMANALIARGRVKDALDIFKTMKLRDDLNNVQLGNINYAMALAKNGDSNSARFMLKKILDRPGRHQAIILEKMVKLYDMELMAKKDHKEKIYNELLPLLESLSKLTGNPFYIYRLGFIHLQMGDREKAQQAFSEVTRLAPEDAYYRKSAEKLSATLTRAPGNIIKPSGEMKR